MIDPTVTRLQLLQLRNATRPIDRDKSIEETLTLPMPPFDKYISSTEILSRQQLLNQTVPNQYEAGKSLEVKL